MSNTCTTPEAPAEVPPAEAGPSAADLGALVELARQSDRLTAQAVLLAGRLAGSGVCERVEGLPLEHFLGLAARLTGADRRMLVVAGEILADLPTVAGLFADGQVSWGQVRAIVGQARRLRKAQRAVLDARIAATVAERGGIDGFDPDQLLWAVDQAADDLRDPKIVERSEARRRESNFLAVQAGLDGGVRLFGDLDPITGATVLNALDAAANRPRAGTANDTREDARGDGSRDDTHGGSSGTADGAHDGTPGDPADRADGNGDGDGRDDGDRGAAAESGWCGTGRGRQYADALERVCAAWLGGSSGGDTERPARPLLIAHLQLSQFGADPDGVVELGVRGGLPSLTAATFEALAADADVQAVIFDSARPLTVTGKAKTIPAATRLAVRARDLGCRFPCSADPLAHCDIHHIAQRARGGDHDPDNLIMLSRRHHTRVHRHHWRLKLNPATGEVVATRGRRRWRSLPRGTPLSRPPPERAGDDPALPRVERDLPF